jgi:hypothetical protein
MAPVYSRIRFILISAVLSALLVVPAAFGAQLESVAGAPRTFAEALRLRRQARENLSRTRPEIVYYDTSGDACLIQGAASLVGATGQPFVSDVMLANYRSTVQKIAIFWLEAGKNNKNESAQYFNLNGHSFNALSDFVTNTLHKSGLGAVAIFSVLSNNNPDLNGNIDAISRIRTPVPGTGGNASLSFPSVPLDDSSGTFSAFAIGLKQNADYRTNVGIVNVDQNGLSHSFQVEVRGTGGSTSFNVTVPAYSLNQFALPAGSWGDLIVIVTPDADIEFSVYAVSVDNKTGDGWANHGTQ